MAVDISKGGRVSLTKDNPGLTIVKAGLGWDVGKEIDLDGSAYLLGEDGKCAGNHNLVYYYEENRSILGVTHSGDNKTGAGDGDDETITIDFKKVPPSIHKVVVTVDIYKAKIRNQGFAGVRNAYIRVYNPSNGTELLRFNLGNDFGKETAVVVGEFYRHNGEWKFRAIGMGYEDGRNDLQRAFMR